MNRPCLFVIALSAGLFCVAGAAQDVAVYAASQAGQGGALFARQCAACHGADLMGGAGPALKGTAFTELAAAQHLTAQALLDRISRTMPMTAPGSLKPDEYAALLAYLLQQSGYPAGAKPLTPDDARLAALDLGKDASGKPAAAPAAPAAAPAAPAAALRPASGGVYADAQVARGKQLYADTCAQCHGGDADGGEEGPPLTGPSFMRKWGALPVGAVHAFIDKNMPPGNAGALGAGQESDIVAFMLWKNGFPPGAAPLPADPAGLNAIGWK